MCGILGIVARSPVNQLLYDGLLLLQHRGQDAAGIVTSEHKTFHMHKGTGMVRDVFRTRNMRSLPGNMGIAHCRYPTAGSASNSAEAQPFYVNSPFGIVLGHNGNLTNSDQLKQEMFRQDLRHINTNSDSEVLLNVLAHELEKASVKLRLDPQTIFTAVAERAPARARRLRGGRDDRRLRRARVPRSLRHPAAGDRLQRDRRRAPSTWWPRNRSRSRRSASACCATSRPARRCSSTRTATSTAGSAPRRRRSPRASSSTSTWRGRTRSSTAPRSTRRGCTWARSSPRRSAASTGTSTIDVVIPIPDSSRPSALQLAHGLGVPYREGFVKNRYIGRTFIMPGQAVRKRSVRQKLNAIGDGVQGQERAAGGRLDRARHDQPRDRADGARGRRAQGVFRLRRAAGALPERLRHRHADARRADRRAPQRGRGRRARSAPTRSSTRTWMRSRRRCAQVNPKLTQLRDLLLRRASTSPATSPATTCTPSRAGATRRATGDEDEGAQLDLNLVANGASMML